MHKNLLSILFGTIILVYMPYILNHFHLVCSTPEEHDGVNPLATLIVQPKHAPIPEIAPDHTVVFEGMVFLFSVSALCLQYINLYKTVWWLPHSNANYALVSA